MNYKTREPIESMLKLNPEENIMLIEEMFKSLAQKGFHFFQWSSFSQPLNKPNAYEQAINSVTGFDELSDREQSRVLREWEKKQGNWFFIETFSEIEGMGFLREEGETFLDCIQKIGETVNEREKCQTHSWAYTHSNGHKTCRNCGFFAPCTIEEALSNYKSGEVKYSKDKILQFNHEKPLCPHCGSHKRFFLRHSIKPEMNYKCAECNQFIKKEKQYSFEKETYEENIKYMFVFINRHTVSKERLFQAINRYISKMYKHAIYVEDIASDSFVEWFNPYFKELFDFMSFFIEKDGSTLKAVGFADFEATLSDEVTNPSFTYKLKFSYSNESIKNADDAFAEGLTEIVEALSKNI